MAGTGFINGNSATVSATGAAGVDMMQTSGFSLETVAVGVGIWFVCKVLDAIYIKITTKK